MAREVEAKPDFAMTLKKLSVAELIKLLAECFECSVDYLRKGALVLAELKSRGLTSRDLRKAFPNLDLVAILDAIADGSLLAELAVVVKDGRLLEILGRLPRDMQGQIAKGEVEFTKVEGTPGKDGKVPTKKIDPRKAKLSDIRDTVNTEAGRPATIDEQIRNVKKEEDRKNESVWQPCGPFSINQQTGDIKYGNRYVTDNEMEVALRRSRAIRAAK